MFYGLVILAANIAIILGNLLFSGTLDGMSTLKFAGLSVLGTVEVIAVDGVTAWLIRRLPERYFSAERRISRVSKGEKDFYRKIKVKAWKDKVPELGGFTGFHKDKVRSTTDRAYLARFVLECNYGVVIHLVNGICGFVILGAPFCLPIGIGFPVAMVNLVLSVLPVAVLRSNLAPLGYLYRKSRRRGDMEKI